MKRLIDSFSIRAAPVFNPENGNDVIFDSFAVKVQEVQTETPTTIIAKRFNAGLQMYHVPEGEIEALRSFSVVPSGFDVMGISMPEHEAVITDILRYRANG
ncbi:MAG: hypothetical protein HDS69_09800 [Bacteroidales bacterium]|nr:hypothetical protein [Bacteroidales bacterium]